MLILIVWSGCLTEHLQVFWVYPPGMNKSGIPGKWFFSELVFKGLVDYLSTED